MAVEGESEKLVPLRRNWNFQILWISQTVSATGRSMSSIAYPLLVLALTGSATKAGLVGTVVAICRYTGAIILAPLIDRVDRRALLIVGDSLRALASTAVAIIVATRHVELGIILPLAGLGGFVSSPVGAAIQAAIVRVVPDEQLEQAMAQDLARADAAGLAGNGLAGLLFGIARLIPFGAEAVGYLASVAGALAVTTSLKVETNGRPRSSWLASTREGLDWLRQRPSVFGVWANLGIINFALAGVDVLVIIYARHSGASSFETGLAVAMGSAAGILGALIAARVIRLLGPTRATLIPIWVTVATIPLLAIAPGFLGLGLVFAAMSLLVPCANVVLTSNLARELDDSMRGRVWSFLGLMLNGLGALGPVVGGALAEAIGRDGALALTAPALITALSFTLIPTLRDHAKPSRPSAVAAAHEE